MKILFVVKSKVLETLGPMYLAATAKLGGHKTRIVEFNEAILMTQDWRPDMIGYSVMTGDQVKFRALNTYIKGFHAFISVVGGPHATFFPKDFISGGFDYIIDGEAELWFHTHLPNMSPIYPDLLDLDTIPFPDRADFPNRPIRDFIATRGCPHKCRYCFNDRWNQMYPDLPKVRYRSVDNLIEEIVCVKPEFVYFQDSCFGVDVKWFKEFSRKYKREVNVPYQCHLRPGQITQERLRMLSVSNCFSVRMALETSSDRLRKLIGRPKSSNSDTIIASHGLKACKIRFMIQNMLALPTSTIDDDLDTLEVNIRCKPDYAWASIFVPFPGTALGDECKDRGWYDGDYSDITDCFFDKSVLKFSEEYKEQTFVLQKIFALAVEAQLMPKIEELNTATMPDFIHRAMRRIGDNRLYNGVI